MAPHPEVADLLRGGHSIARYLGVPTSYLYAIAKRGEVPTFTIGKDGTMLHARKSTLDAWIVQQEAQTISQKISL